MMTFIAPEPDQLIIQYQSKRKLCSLLTGLLEGTADYFETPIRYSQTHCMLKGADACELHLTFA